MAHSVNEVEISCNSYHSLSPVPNDIYRDYSIEFLFHLYIIHFRSLWNFIYFMKEVRACECQSLFQCLRLSVGIDLIPKLSSIYWFRFAHFFAFTNTRAHTHAFRNDEFIDGHLVRTPFVCTR